MSRKLKSKRAHERLMARETKALRMQKGNDKSWTVGRLVIFISTEGPNTECSLRFVERVEHEFIYLEHTSYLLEDDLVTEIISFHDAEEKLRLPLFEFGDLVTFHGKPGVITQCSPNDLHLHVKLDENPEKEIYTNVIHLDFSRTFSAMPTYELK